MSWLAFCVFTLLHVFANLKAVRAVTMQTLNRTRFLMVLKEYAATKKVPSVKETNQQEPFLMGLVPSGKMISLQASWTHLTLILMIF